MKTPKKDYEVLPAEPRPAFADNIAFPEDITSLTAENVSELLGKYTMLQAFANTRRCDAQVRLMQLETSLSLEEAAIRTRELGMGNLQKWKYESKLDTFPNIQLYKKQLLQERIKLERTKTMMEIYEKYTTALSRELSRKMSSNDGTRFSHHTSQG